MPPLRVKGFEIHVGYLDVPAQQALVAAVRGVARAAPFFTPETRRGQKMSVRMTSAGSFGWISDRKGYRYAPRHPDGTAWPQLPAEVRAIWQDLAPGAPDPDSCLVNWYGEGARMGLHQDRDEADFRWPVVSVSLGDQALFRMGGTDRRDATESIWLSSGDVVVMGGDARLAHHGIDRIRFGSSTLLDRGGRINLTLRVSQ
ncbi:alpha-ketoglutarate-dependent dioxygenase AlkB [Sulfitobacter sp. D35]|uniref:alpha-ketoglutarate-dependent dioxygenase AlkB n=1 Tax=Sulfitobacter sp. D35 TaxID=3083252 RepID=UPI00296EA5F9|nr:alpha-ketoglutarate-dependent dioxygenase AlkB [Sulfitobacter sp. D35]MDW4498016.1 alpha-ketoglutarate-dependent dioxygenase AlkB [Sulfitobacter sp. D35]